MVKSYDIFKQLHASKGMMFLNRKKIRAFSLNIFKENLYELKKACEVVENPDNGIKLLSESHSREGIQAHMEVNRLFHNFLASAKSLVDHTRVFMEQYYKGTPILRGYLQKIKTEFAEDPLCRFIQDLRNYMLHKGLPNSSMSLTISKIENSLAHNIVTTVSIDKEQLLLWKNWSNSGKKYLEKCDKQIKISSLTNDYGEKIISFYEWFDSNLEDFHADEIAEFEKMKKDYELLREQEESRSAT